MNWKTIPQKIAAGYIWVRDKRLKLREFPWYRTMERILRVGVIAGVCVFVAQYFGVDVSFKVALAAGVFAGADKIKNEIQEIFRNKQSVEAFFRGY